MEIDLFLKNMNPFYSNQNFAGQDIATQTVKLTDNFKNGMRIRKFGYLEKIETEKFMES